MKICAIITAGGTSSRFGYENKLLVKINGKEVIEHTINAFLNVQEISEIIICANKTIIDHLNNLFSNAPNITIIEGGSSRQKSVYNGLKYISNCDYVLIHDGARPMITPELIKNSIDEVISKKALTVAAKTIDTIKKVNENKKIIKTIDRTFLYNTQTPQAFEYSLIKKAHENFINDSFTDDAGMVEAMGEDVYILEGSHKNIKITTQSDIEIAKNLLK